MPIISRGYTSYGVASGGNSTVQQNQSSGWSGSYVPPSGGIPQSDFSIDVQELLEQVKTHIVDQTIHSSPEQETFWGNKLNYGLDEAEETLHLNHN